jgi:single-strand DNA-binding protein
MASQTVVFLIIAAAVIGTFVIAGRLRSRSYPEMSRDERRSARDERRLQQAQFAAINGGNSAASWGFMGGFDGGGGGHAGGHCGGFDGGGGGFGGGDGGGGGAC